MGTSLSPDVPGVLSPEQTTAIVGSLKRDLQYQLTSDVYELYVHGLTCVGVQGTTWVFGCYDQHRLEWLNLRLRKPFERTLQQALREQGVDMATTTVEFVISKNGQQAMPNVDDGTIDVGVMLGRVRDPGFVRVWHDLRFFYGPMIGLAGVGLWSELAGAAYNQLGQITKLAWPSERSLDNAYLDGRKSIRTARCRLVEVDLIEIHAGRDLVRLYESDSAAGVPADRRRGVSLRRLAAELPDPMNSFIYTVHDPLELLPFCVRFGYALELRGGRVQFSEYPGRISKRWQDILLTIMTALEVTELTPQAMTKLGVSRTSGGGSKLAASDQTLDPQSR